MALDLSASRYGSKERPKGTEMTYNEIMENAKNIYAQRAEELMRDTNDFVVASEIDNLGSNRFSSSTNYQERQKQAAALKERAKYITQGIEYYRDYFDGDSYNAVIAYLSNFDTAIDEALGYYKPGLDAKAGMQAYNDEVLAAIDRNNQARELNKQAMFAVDPSSPAYSMMQRMHQYSTDDSYWWINDSWTDDEKNYFGYLYSSSPAEAKKYGMQLNNYYNAKSTEAARNNIRQNAVDNPFLHTAGALGAGIMFSLPNLMDQVAEYGGRGVLTEKDYVSPYAYSQESVGAISENLNKKYGTYNSEKAREIRAMMGEGLAASGYGADYNTTATDVGDALMNGKGAGDLYNLGYSIAQNYIVAHTLGPFGAAFGNGGAQALTLANFFFNSATSGIDEARKLGASADQAVVSGILKGTWEVATELVGLDNLFDMGPAITWGDLFKQMGTQGLFEAFGEGANAILGYISDYYVLGDLSEYSRTVQEYMDQGMSEKDAKWKAFLDAAANVGFEALSGALSGWVSGGAETALQTGKANMLYRGADARSIADVGLGTDVNSDAYAMSQAMLERVDKGDQISGNDKRILAQNIELQKLAEQRVAAENTAMADLAELGQTGDVRELARITAKHAMGEKLTRKERRTVKQNANVRQLFREMDAENHGKTKNADADTTSAVDFDKPTNVSKEGRSLQISTENVVDVHDFASVDNGKATLQLKDGSTADYGDINFATEEEANQYNAVATLPGLDTENANDMLHAIREAKVGKNTTEAIGIREAYRLGYIGATENDLNNSDASVLPADLRQKIYEIGQKQKADSAAVMPKANAVTAKPSGDYKKVVFEGKITRQTKRIEAKRKAEIAYVDFIAENFSGTTVHVYDSFVGRDGKRYYRDSKGEKHRAPNGMYVNNEIWLDLNSGDNGEGLVLNTFAHEMYHHIEKWNKTKANELVEYLVRELGIENVDKAVEAQIKKARKAGLGESYFMSRGMTDVQARNEVYNRAMSDFVADALETMFTKGNVADSIAKLKPENQGLFDKIKEFVDKWVTNLQKFYSGQTISQEGAMVAQLEKFYEIQKLFMEAMKGAGENYQTALENADPSVDGAEMSNEDSFLDSATAVHYSIRPPYSDGSKAFNAFVDNLTPEAKKTFELFYGFYQRSRITNTVSVSGKKVKAVNISALYLLAQDWNAMLAKEPKWAAAAKELADFLPTAVRERMNMNADGTLNPTTMEKEFKMPSSMAQRLVDALPYESIDATYKLGDKSVTLPDGKARQSVGGEAYRRAILNETRKLFSDGKLKPVGISTMSKDRWGSLGFLAANGKTGASGDFTTVCPQMMFNRGCWYCYRRAAMEKGVNNKLVAQSVWYTGEILRIKDSDIASLNKNGGLRIQSFGDWMPHFSAMLADVLYDAELRGLQVKIITKEPSMINYIAALREQGIGKNLYFNLSADYTIERGPAKQAQGGDSLDAVNPERPYMRDQENSFWWKRAMTVEEASNYREKYPWVNTRIVATDVAEFIRGLKDNRVDVVTGYHGNIRGIERIDSTTGERKIEVEALGDAGMPRFAFNPSTGAWFTEYEGKTATHKRLAQAIAENGLQWEYYIKTCCITGRCAQCAGKCGALARDFNVKNATNRDNESVAYWQQHMEYAVEPEIGDLTVTASYSIRNESTTTADILTSVDISKYNKEVQSHLDLYRDRQEQLDTLEPQLEELNNKIAELSQNNADSNELRKLQADAKNTQREIDRLNKLVRRAERTDMFKLIVAEERQKIQNRQNKETLKSYKQEQRELIEIMRAEQRAIREELTGKESDVTIMEREFVRLAKMYDQDTKIFEREFIRLAKKYDQDSKIWKREFDRLLRKYETADRKIDRLEEQLARQRKTAKERVASRKRTELRHKIQRKVNELNNLLINGTKHRNVPETLRPAVAAILNAINMEVRDGDQRRKTYEATLARYDQRIARASNPAEVSRLIEKRNEYAAKGDQFANKMDQLKEAYRKIQEDKIAGMELDESLYNHLMTLFVIVGDTPLGQMNRKQLEAVNDVLVITMTAVQNANELLAESRKTGIIETSKRIISEVVKVGGGAKTKIAGQKKLEKFGWNNLKPIYAFELIGSDTLTELFNNLRDAEDVFAIDAQEAKNFFRYQWQKYGGKNWDMEFRWTFKSTSGKTFELDLNQIMTLYAMEKDNDAKAHLRVGGFTFAKDYQFKEDLTVGPASIPIKKESTDASAYNLSDEILGEIISKLEPEQRKFVDAMQTYLSDNMAAKGNEVSLKKYGIRLFKNKNYFPIITSAEYMSKKRETQGDYRKLKEAGFTNARKPEAKNPVVLSDFTEVWGRHVDEMSLYHAYVLPLDDIDRVLNYSDKFVEGGDPKSVSQTISEAYGAAAMEYIDNLIRDVNGGNIKNSTTSFANSLVSKAKKVQTMASLSVAIQQPSSIIRAMAMVAPKYFVGKSVTEKTMDRTWEKIKKYAPIAIIKEKGGFDTHVGKSTVDYLTDTTDYQTFPEKFKAFFTDSNYRDDRFGRLPALMDEVTWSNIWNAIEREMHDEHSDMDVNSDAFMKLVAKRFTDVIVHTQVYDSVFSRSGIMRDSGDLAKMATVYMAEPLTTANMLAVAVIKAKRGDSGANANLAKTIAAIAGSLLLTAALQSVVYAIRDDDEKKSFYEKWMKEFHANFFESLNPANYIPFVRDLYNITKGYDVTRADMDLYSDLVKSIKNLSSDELTPWEKVEGVIGSTGNFLGIPLRNIIRDVKGLVNTFLVFPFDEIATPTTKTGKYLAATNQELSDGEQLLLAIQRGDDAHIQRVAGRFESQEKAASALKSAIRAAYLDGSLSAAEAEELLGTYFDDNDEHDIFWTMDRWNYAKENGTDEGWSKYGKLHAAIESGEDYADVIAYYMEHGSDASDIRSQITRVYRKQYLEADDSGRAAIRDKLLPVYLETGMEKQDVLDKFNDWDFEAEYGMTFSQMKAEYRNGNVTEREMRAAMRFYGMKSYEIEDGIRSMNEDIAFAKRYGMSKGDFFDAYDRGDVSRNTAIDALMYTGMTKAQATKEIKQRDIGNRLGIDYAELDDAYKHGDISRQTLYNAIVEAGATKEEAEEAVVCYDWLKKNVKKYPDLTVSDARKFVIRISDNAKEYTLSDYGVTIDTYIEYSKRRIDCKGVDADGDGETDEGTLRDSIFEMIDSLPISDEAKDGLALISYGIKSIRKNAPWHK